MKSLIKYIVAMTLVTLFSLPVQAVLVETNFQGTVTLDNAGDNPFGLNIGDSISGTAIWDDAAVTGTSTDELILLSSQSGWSFSITLGSFTFTEADVTDPNYSAFYFNLGAFDGVSFFIEPIDINGFNDLLVEDFFGGGLGLFVEDFFTGNPVYLEADWDFANATTTPVQVAVPEPASIALLGFGLLGMGWRQRRLMTKNK